MKQKKTNPDMESKLSQNQSTFFNGMSKDSRLESFRGVFAFLRVMLDPLVFTKPIREIQVSNVIYRLFLDYCNSYSRITFTNITAWYNIPITVNESFDDTTIEFHMADRIEFITINL